MFTVFIARRDPARARQAQALLETARDLRAIGTAHSLFRARPALARADADALLIDLRLEDGAALSLVHELRERGADRPRVMLVAPRGDDPLLFATLLAGADAYLLESDLSLVAVALVRMRAGEATMAPAIAAQVLHFFGEDPAWPDQRSAADDRQLDWHTQAANPMRLSPGEHRLLHLIMGGLRSAEIAARTATSVESVGRRIGNLYRKLGWDVRSGALSLLAA
jgi:two-component system response regulator DevR